MTEEDKKLYEKFEEIIKNKPSDSEALDFWSKLSAKEYDRLIYLFENNEIEGMPESVRKKLAETFRKLKEAIGK